MSNQKRDLTFLCHPVYMSLQDHPELVQKVTKLLVKLVKHNPDLSESSWQHRTASLVPIMMMRDSGSVFSTIVVGTLFFVNVQ